MKKGNTRKERIEYQLAEWVKGNAIHNDVDNECCPDFGCCIPKNLQTKAIRETFAAANEDQRYRMLMVFLGSAFAAGSEKKTYIAGSSEFEQN